MLPNSLKKCDYPDLPVVKHRLKFLNYLKTNQVIIVQADTGSGKSTQLPKMLLESGIAENGKIGVTQPRRLAALSIADRLREELKDESLVASKIRFFEEGPENAPIKVMTDGILLQEFRKDRLFKQYSAILIDEIGQYNQIELKYIDRIAKKAGIVVIGFGDHCQIGDIIEYEDVDGKTRKAVSSYTDTQC